VSERVRHFREFVIPLSEKETRDQAARCMDCGIPYCHNGCPVNNQIPDWNDLVYRDDWEEAIRNLHSTNNFPEFTGRVCPAPCEASCTLNIIDKPVTIKTIECAIIDRAWENGWVKPEPPAVKTGNKIAIVGSGPAGLACAQQLARAGHEVHVYERWAKAGGLLRYGIPDFKMEKYHVDRRVEQMQAEGVVFHYNAHVGVNVDAEKIVSGHDAVVLTGGAEKPRDLPIEGRELDGIHFAMDFLPQQNRRVSNEPQDGVKPILAGGKHVVVIGGGDTGSDCIGTSIRQGALSVVNFEIMPQPPAKENKELTWPDWPLKLRTSSSHEEGAERDFSVLTQKFTGENGRVQKLHCIRVDEKLKPVPGTEFELKADLVLLAMGFVSPVHAGMIEKLGLKLDGRGNVEANTLKYQTSNPKVFAAGDMRRGQSLVVWAIREGRQAARSVDEYLTGSSDLPR
jgi:glutamate synthase (NADPH/NADH) small chain